MSSRFIQDPPVNPKGGKTLVVDAKDPDAYPLPSAALKEAGKDDQAGGDDDIIDADFTVKN